MTDAALPTPMRLQYSRTTRRSSEPAVLVSGQTRWRNPFLIGEDGVANRERAVAEFREALLENRLDITVDDVRRQLRGQNLACWCPLDRPCHADVLLEVANSMDDASASTAVLEDAARIE
ncbi:DUF4326 domain-containing protein [Naasia aerilata]|uniref:DUF4326 domain-containing protein n=1 Tax=Naasia aerilata TaxID=1162966 RepID=A0ABM8GEG0_9MICO|nr:DUF4326 domain-containing protein [Naasia aerilata]BDZ46703.1 hypothetical protein GCM10025866_26120 [Naasia aerilata]